MAKNPVTREIGPGTTRASDTLYERIGGEKKLDEIVTMVYDSMRADKEIGKQFARFRLERLKDRTVDYLRGEWGGNGYKGPDLWISHSHLGVSNHWYDIMMKYYVAALKKHRIGKQETKEALESLEKMRAPVVDRDLKFKNMYLKHVEKEAAKAGGDGWGTVAATPEQREAKERATLELLQKQKQKEMEEEERKKLKAFEEAEARKKAQEAAAEAKKSEAEAKKSEGESKKAGGGNKRPASNSPQVSGEVPEGEVAEAKVSQKGSRPRSKNRKEGERKEEPKEEAPAKPSVDPRLFVFNPDEDAPPMELPSSMPSGAELLYRLSVPCPVR